MRLLLDSHVFVWWDISPKKIPQHVSAALVNPSNTILLSVASIWEMQIKIQAGKLHLTRPLRDVVLAQQQTNGMGLMPITADHIWALEPLPWYHKDPFDRVLIAQANTEGTRLVSEDHVFSKYAVDIFWK
jgi:PIN domain nuclease of toxin-antitoxin system